MLKIDKYYDIRCDICGRSRSEDIDGGCEMCMESASYFRKALAKEGWKSINEKNLCPYCAKNVEKL